MIKCDALKRIKIYFEAKFLGYFKRHAPGRQIKLTKTRNIFEQITKMDKQSYFKRCLLRQSHLNY
jgi:hypothetical protein